MTPGELVEAVEGAGFRVTVRPDLTPQLTRCRKDAGCVPPELLEQLKLRRDEVVDYVCDHCEGCDRLIACPEDEERLRGPNPFCDEPKCPYRSNRR